MKHLILALVLFFSFTTQAKEKSKKLEEKSMIQVLNYIHTMGKDIYCYWDIKKKMFGVDWDQIISKAKESITKDTTLEEFKGILTKVASKVKDGHVGYSHFHKKMRLFYIPLRFKELKNKIYTTVSYSDSLTGKKILAGSQIIAVDGMPVEEFLSGMVAFTRGSTPAMVRAGSIRYLRSYPYFKSAPLKPRTFTFKTLDNQTKTIEIGWSIRNYDPDTPRTAEGFSEHVQTKILPGNIGYLAVESMWHPKGNSAYIKHIYTQMDALKNTRALIIDVRRNGGGSGNIGDAIVARLTDKKVNRYKGSLKLSRQVLQARGDGFLNMFSNITRFDDDFSPWLDFEIKPQGESVRYKKPVVLLTSVKCYSACDTFADSFSANKIGTVMGTRTGGGTGYPLSFKLPHDLGSFKFSVLKGMSMHGRLLEGTGTIPDIELLPTRANIARGEDGVLMQAYAHVKKNILGEKTDFTEVTFKRDFSREQVHQLYEDISSGERF